MWPDKGKCRMWITFGGGFISAVEDKKDSTGGTLVVRARDRESLINLINTVELAGAEEAAGVAVERLTEDDIVTGEGTDYRYRVRMSKGTFALAIQWEILNMITYKNFKDHLTESRGKVFHDACMAVWWDMLAVDDVNGERYRDRAGAWA